jgi:hypothetical protein
VYKFTEEYYLLEVLEVSENVLGQDLMWPHGNLMRILVRKAFQINIIEFTSLE